MELCLITGGVRSGKSSFAEQYVKNIDGSVLYVATSLQTDHEMKERIDKHKARRPEQWELLEEPYSLESIIPFCKKDNTILIDCMSSWVTNLLMTAESLNKRDPIVTETILGDAREWLKAIRNLEGTIVIVTNETGLGGVAMSPLGRWFQDVLGEINQMIADEATSVYLVLSGIPVRIKG